MAKQGNIKFNVGFNVDKSGLEQLKSSLANLQHIDKFDLVDASADIKDLQEIQRVAAQVGTALQSSFNKDLGTYNIQQFKKALADANLTTQSVGKSFTQAGETGKIAFRNMVSAISSTKLELKETHNLLDKMGETLSNTIRWSIASSALNSVTGAVQKAWTFTKQLDTSLNDIMIVTGKSSDEMDRFAVKANSAAKALGATTKSYADAALIYYQQGLSDEEAAARSETTVKVANVTGQSANAVSEQLTAVWNGYKVSAQEAESYIDKLSAVAATTAADLEELSTGMSRVASAANVMGVDVDQLNAQLATIVSVTREAPESIGTALKTVYARMSDIEAGLDTETTLGEYTTQMAEMGINVLDAKGNLRDMGDVVEEIGGKWNSLNREQQVSLAQSIAGTRQYSRMMALFDNWDMYQEALTTSQTSMGTLQKQQDIYMESLEGHLNKLTATAETLYSKLFDSDSFKTVIDIASGALGVISQFVESLGGGGALLAALLPTLTNLFSKNIAEGLATTATNFLNARDNATQLKEALARVEDTIQAIDNENIDNISEQFLQMKKQLIELRQQGLVTDEQFKEMSEEYEEIIKLANSASAIRAERENLDKRMGDVSISGTPGSPEEKFASLQSIADIAATGDTTGAQKMANDYMAEVAATRLTMVEDLGELSFDESFNIDEQLYALEEYRSKLQETAQESGLLTADQLEDLNASTLEVEKLVAARQREYEIQKEIENLKALQEEKAGYETFYSEVGVDPDNPDQYTDVDAKSAANADAIAASEERLALLRQEQRGYEDLEKKASQVLDRLNQTQQKTNKQAKKGYEDLKKAAKTAASGIEKELDQKTKNAANKAKKNLKKIDFKGVINGVTKTTSAIGQMAAAIGVLHNLGSIWRSEDLTTGQKLFQSIMNITSAIGLMMPVLTMVNTAYSTWNTKRKTSAMLSTLENTAIGKDTASKLINQAATLGSAGSTALLEKVKSKLTEEEYKAIAAEIKENGALGANSLATIAAAMGNTALAKALKGVTTATATSTPAVIANATAWYMHPIVWILAIIVAAVAATALLTVGIIALTRALSKSSAAKAAEDAKKATEHANAMAEAYKNVKSEYEELKKSIEDYQNAQKAIDELAAGTDEWRAAIAEANTQVMELIKQYPELAQYMSNEGGRLVISEEGLKKAEEAKQKEVYSANRSALLAQQRASEANIRAQEAKAHEEINGEFTRAEGAAIGAIVGGLVFGAPGAAILGGTIGAIAAGKDVTTEDQTKEAAEVLAQSPDAFVDRVSFEEALKGTEFEAMADELWENKTALQELTEATKAAEAEQAALRHQIALSMLQENAVYQGLMKEYAELSEEKAAIKREDYNSATEYYEAQAKKQKELDEKQEQIDVAEALYSSKGMQADIKNEATTAVNDQWGSASRDERENMIKQYWSKKLGIPVDDIEVKSAGKSGKYKVRWRGEDGQLTDWEKNDTDSMLSGLADMKASEYQIDDKKLNDQLNKWKKLGEQNKAAQKAFKSFVGDGKGDFAQLTKAEFDAITKQWQGKKTLDDLSAEALQELKTYAEALGLGTTDEALTTLLEGINEGVRNYEMQEEKIDNLFLGRLQVANDSNQGIFNDDASLQAFNSFSQSTRLALGTLWSDLSASTESGAAIINSILNKMTDKNKDLIASSLLNTDWTDQESINLYKEAMESVGFTAEEAAEQVLELKLAADAIADFDLSKAEKSFATLQSLMSSVNEYGDTISEDEYDTLSDAMQQYFKRMGEGTYALIGDAEAFKKAAAQAATENLLLQLDEQQAKNKKETADKNDLTSTRKAAIELEVKQEYALAAKNALDESNMGGGFTTTKDLGDGFFGEVGEWFATGGRGGYTISDIAGAQKAIALIRKYNVASQGLVDGWNAQIASGHMDETSYEDFMKNFEDAKQKARDAAASYQNTNNIDQAIADRIQAEKDAQGITGTAKLTISSSELNAIDQIFVTQGTATDLEQQYQKILSKYSAENGYTDADREKIKSKYESAKDVLENMLASFEIEIDPYEQINRSLETTEQKLSKLQSEQELFVEGGQEYLDNLTKQNILLNEQIVKQRQLKALAEDEKTKAKDKIINQLNKIDPENKLGLSEKLNIDPETGEITNWKELMQIVSEQLRNGDLNEANRIGNDLKLWYEDYNTALDQIAEADSVIREKAIQQLENNLAAFEAKISLEIDKREFQRTLEDFKKSFLDEDDFFGIGVSLETSFNLARDDVTTYQLALKDLSSYEIISQEEFDKLTATGAITEKQLTAKMMEEKEQELLNSLIDTGLSMQEAHESMLENIVAYHEAMTEAYDEYVSLIENANSALEHQKTLIELMYGSKAASQLNNYYTSQLNNQSKIIEMRQQEYTMAYAQINAEKFATLSEEEQKAIQERYLKASEDYFSAITDMAQMYQDQYLNTIQAAFEEFTNAFNKDDYDWAISTSQDFLNSIDSAFGIQSVERAFDKSINMNTSISAQEKLNKLRDEELAKLNAKDKLTKYDLERAQKRLAVTQAEIALQEAQANKSKMRLVRGADGTYSYQYEADMDAISKAEESLAKANQDLVQLDEQELQRNYDRAYALIEEYYQKIQDLDPIKDAAEIEALRNKYGAQIEALGLSANQVYENLKASVAEAGQFLGKDFNLDVEIDWANSEFAQAIRTFDKDGGSWVEFTSKVSGAATTLKTSLTELNTELNSHLSIYNNLLEEKLIPASEAVIQDLEKLAVDGSLDNLRTAAELAATALKTAASTITSTVNKGIASTTATTNLGSILNISQRENQNMSIAAAHGGYTYRIEDVDSWRSQIQQWFGKGGVFELTDEQRAAFAEKYGYTDGDFDTFISQITDDEYIWKSNWDILQKLLRDLGIGSFDTGGYTGEWGTSEKMALLHEKELVLNQEDTQNILNAVETMRSLENSISASMLENVLTALQNLTAVQMQAYQRDAEKVVQQKVEISAEFPNVDSKAEIEAAFDELITLAYQKAYEN